MDDKITSKILTSILNAIEPDDRGLYMQIEESGGRRRALFMCNLGQLKQLVRMVMEPPGGNLYKPHALQVDSGTMWRCAHGQTGFGPGMSWIGCTECAEACPDAARRWRET